MRRVRLVVGSRRCNGIKEIDRTASAECFVLLVHFIQHLSTLLHLAKCFVATIHNFFVIDTTKRYPDAKTSYNTPCWDNQQISPDDNKSLRPVRLKITSQDIILFHQNELRTTSTNKGIAPINNANVRARIQYRCGIVTSDIGT